LKKQSVTMKKGLIPLPKLLLKSKKEGVSTSEKRFFPYDKEKQKKKEKFKRKRTISKTSREAGEHNGESDRTNFFPLETSVRGIGFGQSLEKGRPLESLSDS